MYKQEAGCFLKQVLNIKICFFHIQQTRKVILQKSAQMQQKKTKQDRNKLATQA